MRSIRPCKNTNNRLETFVTNTNKHALLSWQKKKKKSQWKNASCVWTPPLPVCGTSAFLNANPSPLPPKNILFRFTQARPPVSRVESSLVQEVEGIHGGDWTCTHTQVTPNHKYLHNDLVHTRKHEEENLRHNSSIHTCGKRSTTNGSTHTEWETWRRHVFNQRFSSGTVSFLRPSANITSLLARSPRGRSAPAAARLTAGHGLVLGPSEIRTQRGIVRETAANETCTQKYEDTTRRHKTLTHAKASNGCRWRPERRMRRWSSVLMTDPADVWPQSKQASVSSRLLKRDRREDLKSFSREALNTQLEWEYAPLWKDLSGTIHQ